MPRAGKVADSSPRAIVTSPLSRGCRSASMTSVRKRGNSSRKRMPLWARLISPGRTRPVPPPRRLARLASWCGAKNGGGGGIEALGARAPAGGGVAGSSSGSPGGRGRAGEHRVAGLQRAGERVDRRQLQRLLEGQVGEDAGDPLGEGGLPGAPGAREHEVVTAGRGDLEGEARVLHAEQVRQVLLGHPL